MRLLLVNPPGVSQGGKSNPVLGLLYLAGYVKDIADVKYFDGFIADWKQYQDTLRDFKPDYVGVQMLTPGRHQALKALSIAKDCGAKTIAGGPHATIMTEQLIANYDFIDHIVKGEGEYGLRQILEGNTDKVIKCSELDINSIPYPAWELGHLDSTRYIGGEDIRVPIIASRGCKGNCIFCSTQKFWRKYRVRSAENIIGEIDYIIEKFGKKHFVFEDDSLSCNLDITKDIMRNLTGRGIRFFATMRADGMDDELAFLLKSAGCYEASFGIESGSQEVLDAYNKKTTVKQNIKAIKVLKEAGIKVCALMIKNGIKDNQKTRDETQRFLDIAQPDVTGSVGNLWVLPGTKIYNDMKQKGFLDDSFWLGSEPYYIYKGELD